MSDVEQFFMCLFFLIVRCISPHTAKKTQYSQKKKRKICLKRQSKAHYLFHEVLFGHLHFPEPCDTHSLLVLSN